MKSCFYCSLKKAENQVFCAIFLIFFKKQSPFGLCQQIYLAAIPFSAVNSIFSGLDLLSEPM